MYTLYRSPAAFYECMITVVIAFLRTAAAQENFLYYPLYTLLGIKGYVMPVGRQYCKVKLTNLITQGLKTLCNQRM